MKEKKYIFKLEEEAAPEHLPTGTREPKFSASINTSRNGSSKK